MECFRKAVLPPKERSRASGRYPARFGASRSYFLSKNVPFEPFRLLFRLPGRLLSEAAHAIIKILHPAGFSLWNEASGSHFHPSSIPPTAAEEEPPCRRRNGASMVLWQVLFWAVITIALIIFEFSTVQLVAVWFAAGGLAAFISSFFGLSFTGHSYCWPLHGLLSISFSKENTPPPIPTV